MVDAPKPAALLTEIIPNVVGELSAIASANAPFIYFDGAPTYGIVDNVANVTLEALRNVMVQGEVRRDRVIVAHLRMSLAAAQSLRAALDGIFLMATPKPPGEAH